jgi:hypothetical protein
MATVTRLHYAEHDTLPAWTQAVWEGDTVVNANDPCKWSGKNPPPAIGERIKVSMNRLGWGRVAKYFVEHGWLGVLVKFEDPPKWYVTQNKERGGRDALGHIYGMEIDGVRG